jgi:hypothetical protein
LRAGKAIRALEATFAGKALGDLKLIGGENVDPENSKTLQQRP